MSATEASSGLRSRPLIALLTAEAVSSLGSQMTFLALPWFVLVTTGSVRDTIVARQTETFGLIGSPAFPTPEIERRDFAGRAFDRAFRPGGTLRQMHAIVATGSFEPLLKNVSAPTQIIHGTHDPLVRPACGRRSAALIRGARLELIEGMGHDCPASLMPRWAELIADNAGRAA